MPESTSNQLALEQEEAAPTPAPMPATPIPIPHAARDAVDAAIAFISAGVGLLDIFPRLGYSPIAIGALYFLYTWALNDTSRPSRVYSAIRAGFRAAFSSFKDWWQLALGLTGLVACVVFQVTGLLPIYWRDTNYLHEHKSLPIATITSASEAFSPSALPGKDFRSSKQREMEEWKYWMSSGVLGDNLIYVDSPEFDSDYASFTAAITLDSNYKVQKAYAFLQDDRPEFENDPDYRPVLRQMDARPNRNGNSITIGVEDPREGEKLIVFFQAIRSDEKSTNPKQCLLNDYMEVRKK